MTQIEKTLQKSLQRAVKAAFSLDIKAEDVFIELPKDKQHGDYATNLAMQLAKRLQGSPRALAEELIAHLDKEAANLQHCEVAGPGFINFTMNTASLTMVINKVLESKENYGSITVASAEKYNLEFVSTNPTGDLHPGHARGAAIGDSVARLMKFAGYDITKEYYVNDAGNQIDLMGKTLQARYFQALGRSMEIPPDGYHGQDLIDIAKELINEVGDKYLELPLSESLEAFKDYGLKAELQKIKETLALFRVEFDVWTSEAELSAQGKVRKTLARLEELGQTYVADGAVWLRTTEYGDDKDRVLVKSDGSYTYLMPDIAYHLDKFERGFTKLVDFLGADHHGYVPRLKAAIGALGKSQDDLSVEIIQMVRMIKDNAEYKLSKRTGQAIALADLIEEAGVDAVRYLFVSKAADTHMDLDLDLAVKQSNENPVYYVQYAHARMCSIMKNVDKYETPTAFELLTHEKELTLLKQINEFPKVIAEAAKSRQPHKLCNYLQKLAGNFHTYYNECKVITEDEELQNQRLALIKATQITIKNALGLIGVEAVERM